MKKTETVFSDDDIEALRLANERKAAEAIAKMGVKYACHASNVLRKDPAKANFAPEQYKVTYHTPAPVFLLKKKGAK